MVIWTTLTVVFLRRAKKKYFGLGPWARARRHWGINGRQYWGIDWCAVLVHAGGNAEGRAGTVGITGERERRKAKQLATRSVTHRPSLNTENADSPCQGPCLRRVWRVSQEIRKNRQETQAWYQQLWSYASGVVLGTMSLSFQVFPDYVKGKAQQVHAQAQLYS